MCERGIFKCVGGGGGGGGQEEGFCSVPPPVQKSHRLFKILYIF